MAERRFYWLKLQEDFFSNKRIKKLRRVECGDTFVIIYLKMLLQSMKTDGKLFFDGLETNITDEIALEIDEDAEKVGLTIKYLSSVGLIEIGADDVTMNELPIMVGSEQASAKRVRSMREKRKALQCNDAVTDSNERVTESKSIDTELDEEKECVRTQTAVLGSQVVYEDEYRVLCNEIGREFVDNTIQRIVNTPYNGCLTVDKISQWAIEAKTKSESKKNERGVNRFNNYQQRNTDYDALVTECQKSLYGAGVAGGDV